MKLKVFISSPYTIGDTGENIRVQMKAFNQLLNHGFIPFAPLLSHFQHIYYPRSHREWVEYDLHWLMECDYLLRLPGESAGADIEVKEALRAGIPVVYSIDELKIL